MRISTTIKAIAASAAVALLSTGCLSQSSSTSSGGNGNTSKTISIMYGFTGDADKAFRKEITSYASTQGIKVNFIPSSNFNVLINTKDKANNLPDIALFPQPGLLKPFVDEGKLADLDSVLNVSDLKAHEVKGLLNAGTFNGKLYAVAPSINVKSIVYYPKAAWASAGLTPPTTLSGLLDLTTQLRSSGKTPWCMGIESGTATGWPATDWLENLVLVDGGTSQYNDWVSHKVKFDSPLVNQAASQFAQIMFTNGDVFGGRQSISSNNFGTAGNPMFTNPPGCYMYKQGNFVAGPGFFPTNVLSSLDNTVGVFQFPGKTASDRPVEGGGDLAALFSKNNTSAQKVMKFMTSAKFGQQWAGIGGYISPRTDFDMSKYPNQTTKDFAKIAYNTTGFVFDGSDAMPAAVGTGTFWTQMTAWINGTASQQAALQAIDASWPAS